MSSSSRSRQSTPRMSSEYKSGVPSFYDNGLASTPPSSLPRRGGGLMSGGEIRVDGVDSSTRLSRTFPRVNRTRPVGSFVSSVSSSFRPTGAKESSGMSGSSLHRRIQEDSFYAGHDQDDNLLDDEFDGEDQLEAYDDEEDEQALANFERRSTELLRGSGTNRKLAQHCPQCKRMVEVTLKAKAERDKMEEAVKKCEEDVQKYRMSLARCKQKKESTTMMLREELQQTADYVKSQYEAHHRELTLMKEENYQLKSAIDAAKREHEQQLAEWKSKSSEEQLKLHYDLEQAAKDLKAAEEYSLRLVSNVEELKRDREEARRARDEFKDRVTTADRQCVELKTELTAVRKSYDDLVSAGQVERTEIRQGFEKELNELRELIHHFEAEKSQTEEHLQRRVQQERTRLEQIHRLQVESLTREHEEEVERLERTLEVLSKERDSLKAKEDSPSNSVTETSKGEMQALKDSFELAKKEHLKAVDVLKTMYEQQVENAQSSAAQALKKAERIETELQEAKSALERAQKVIPSTQLQSKISELEKARADDLELFKRQYAQLERDNHVDNHNRKGPSPKGWLYWFVSAMVGSTLTLALLAMMWTPRMTPYTPGLEALARFKESVIGSLGLEASRAPLPPM